MAELSINNCDKALGLRDSLTLRFSWESLPDAPAGILGTSPPAVIGSEAYFYAAHTNVVHKLQTYKKLWSLVPTLLEHFLSLLSMFRTHLLLWGGGGGGGKIPCSYCLNNLKRFVNEGG